MVAENCLRAVACGSGGVGGGGTAEKNLEVIATNKAARCNLGQKKRRTNGD